ncbi:MAG: 1-deoxy-D-xylulose-5-phosphate synthase [Myxococcaceae bacterium]|nr:1-deoxy-D-xylulose-5-phosphate synthase [Myxococcaceae bacterium]MCA3014056.1 1-deoxy-D-xylulose-5-phosphate synthase [Myxococcaceae bacterium]
MTVLERLTSPADVRALDEGMLDGLCAELRQAIIATCGAVGGHLGASLGTVELIVALHRVYRTPVDRLVFDVGHQAYAHKLLTGRAARMGTLRQEGGLAPFLDPIESPHDAFGAGHACTAVSVAVGMLEGLHRTGAPGQVVVIVGDGALTGGLTFEGLNHAAVASRGLVVVLNDNGMSISTNVGAVRAMLEHDARRFFEALGFVYVGALDGHDVRGLVAALRAAKASTKPVLLHVRTQKGRGFGPAEDDPQTRGHAMGPYELRDGKLVRTRGGRSTWSEAFARTLEARLAVDERVVVITPAMLEGSSLVGLKARFPSRVFDVGIAEQHAVTFAAGLATTGLRPVVCVYSTFLQRAYDQLVHDVALPGLPVVFAVDRAGLVGADGATHQGAFDVSFLRPLPGFSITSPVFADELEPLLDDALRRGRPSVLRFPRGVLPEAVRPAGIAAPGASRWLHRPGAAPLAFVSTGVTALAALEAARPAGFGVLDAGDLAQLDGALVAEAASTGALVLAEEATPRGGLADAVREVLVERRLSPKVRGLALPVDHFVRHGEANAQRRALGLDAVGLARAARELLAS